MQKAPSPPGEVAAGFANAYQLAVVRFQSKQQRVQSAAEIDEGAHGCALVVLSGRCLSCPGKSRRRAFAARFSIRERKNFDAVVNDSQPLFGHVCRRGKAVSGI